MGFKDTVQKQRNEAVAAAGKVRPKGLPRRMFLKSDKPEFVSFLHGFDYSVDLNLHFKAEDKTTHVCNKMYDRDCDFCNQINDRGKKNIPQRVRAFIVFNHGAVGLKWTSPKTGNVYDVDPVMVAELRPGKGEVNYGVLKAADTNDYLMDNNNVWQLKKEGAGIKTVYLQPGMLPKKVLGPECSPNVPASVLKKFKDMSESQILSLVLANYENVDADFLKNEVDEDGKPQFPDFETLEELVARLGVDSSESQDDGDEPEKEVTPAHEALR